MKKIGERQKLKLKDLCHFGLFTIVTHKFGKSDYSVYKLHCPRYIVKYKHIYIFIVIYKVEISVSLCVCFDVQSTFMNPLAKNFDRVIQ